MFGNLFWTSPSEGQPQPKLKLSRIECLSRLSKRRVRNWSRSEGVVWDSEVRAVEKIKTLCQQIEVQAFGNAKATTEAHIERGIVESASGITANTNRSIVVVGIEVTIAS